MAKKRYRVKEESCDSTKEFFYSFYGNMEPAEIENCQKVGMGNDELKRLHDEWRVKQPFRTWRSEHFEEVEPEENFAVIGGQYEIYCHGVTDTLHKAKLLAARSREYWDNWQGWHTPQIYRMEDCEKIISHGRITSYEGAEIIVPKEFAEPFLCYDGKRWVRFEI